MYNIVIMVGIKTKKEIIFIDGEEILTFSPFFSILHLVFRIKKEVN